MQTQKLNRPAFKAVDLDPIDSRLEVRAAEKGIPTLVEPGAGERRERAPRVRKVKLSVDVPEYVWTALRMRAAQEMVTVRHVVMKALKESGIDIDDADMVDDGRRARN
jgi:hypothetical protein